jgi:antiviral helicase SKI2
MHGCEFRNHHLKLSLTVEDLWWEYEAQRQLMSTTGREKMDDYVAKVKIFMQYGYFDRQMNMQSKGRVADEIQSTDKIITTELLYSGMLNKLTNEECVALFSVLVSNVKAGPKCQPCVETLSENFNEALLFLDATCDRLIEIESQYSVVDTDCDKDKRLNYYFYELIHAWATKTPFLEVVKASPGLDEGTIVRMVNCVERMTQHIKAAARVMGDSKLSQRMEECSVLIKRDIIFAPSLYLE